MRKVKISLLHLLPIAGDISSNQKLIEDAVRCAAAKEVDWIITPELAVSGLQFSRKIGKQWINQQPDEWMTRFMDLVKSLQVNVFLGCPEKSNEDKYYNSVFVIGKNGQLLGTQRKVSSVTDDWSSSGEAIEPISVDGIKVGLSICADSYTPAIANTLLEKGSEILIAPSAWGPGLHGPDGEWEQRSIDTGLPLFVCNRTGEDETVLFWEAKSLVIKNGEHLLSHSSKQSAILTFEWNLEERDMISDQFDVEYVK
ncbi:carbon-nitrogen hydrolase family protein [Alkalihalophilus sp. As8PL]|uniref:Carbon-nitrogen hydrolase family protein n=1 Tax=Alkalihalophilus sp. As8PL TaxID=3237103 RepID=A0AB39BVT0_9BACI